MTTNMPSFEHPKNSIVLASRKDLDVVATIKAPEQEAYFVGFGPLQLPDSVDDFSMFLWFEFLATGKHTGLASNMFECALRFSQSRQRQLAVALDVSGGATSAFRMNDFSKEIAEGFMCSCAAERSGELKKMGEEVNLVKSTSRFVSCFGWVKRNKVAACSHDAVEFAKIYMHHAFEFALQFL